MNDDTIQAAMKLQILYIIDHGHESTLEQMISDLKQPPELFAAAFNRMCERGYSSFPQDDE
jgi:hypothetical protein